jgi:putative ABC transport system permease protein
MNRLIVGNLVHRPLRSLISVLAIALEVIMILIMAGVMLGQLNDARSRQSGIGADMLVRPANSTFLSGVSGAPVSAKVADVLRQLPHVQVVAPVIEQLTTGNGLEIIWGIDYASYNGLRPFVFVSGGPFNGPNDVIVDDIFAQSGKKYKVGDTVLVLNHPFRICGIVQHGKGGRRFIPIETMGSLIGSEGKASLFYLKVDDLKNEDLVRQEIAARPGMSGYQVQTMEEYLSMMTPSSYPGFTIALNIVITTAMVIGFLVIFQSMYTAVLERTREIGILKAMGASRATIVGVVMRETALLAVTGIIVGIILAIGARQLAAFRFPTFHIDMTPAWMLRASVLAFVGAMLGTAYPALKAARKDPIDALAYE